MVSCPYFPQTTAFACNKIGSLNLDGPGPYQLTLDTEPETFKHRNIT